MNLHENTRMLLARFGLMKLRLGTKLIWQKQPAPQGYRLKAQKKIAYISYFL
jgi:hypothetical protein